MELLEKESIDFYLERAWTVLRYGHKFIDALSHFFPKAIRKELRQTVKELNETTHQ